MLSPPPTAPAASGTACATGPAPTPGAVPIGTAAMSGTGAAVAGGGIGTAAVTGTAAFAGGAKSRSDVEAEGGLGAGQWGGLVKGVALTVAALAVDSVRRMLPLLRLGF